MTAGTLTMWSPQSTSSGSIMPGYKWLFDNEPLDISDIEAKMKVMQTLGVPYTDAEVTNAKKSNTITISKN
jgi:cytochrome c oxidase cbb3-type subunit I/II